MATAVVGLAHVGAATVGSGYVSAGSVREIELGAVLAAQPNGLAAYWGSPIWSLDRGSTEWVGPIAVTLTVDGVSLPVTADVALQFAFIPKTNPLTGGVNRPLSSDWVAPYANPSGNGDIGVFVPASAVALQSGVWVRYVDNPETIVLPPSTVGWVNQR